MEGKMKAVALHAILEIERPYLKKEVYCEL
ncbi:hypothetical protein NPD7_3407 [Clostridium sporogenes]|nr:hypothetical protein NPD7_3407 [Clostridium sporogenes]